MWNLKKDAIVLKMMLGAVLIVAVTLAAVIFTFVILQKRHEETISAATDTEGQTEIAIEIGQAQGDDEEQNIEESEDSGTYRGGTAIDTTEKVYLIKGNDTGSNPYEKADRLAYTDSVCYTWEELDCLDSYGLCITRNEIYARHGRMFSDKDIQDYFDRQEWYVAQTASADFDESVLNEVEQYNVELIHSYERQQGY